MISFTDIVEALGMLKEAKNAGLSGLEATILICYIVKDLLIVSAIIGLIVWFKQIKEMK